MGGQGVTGDLGGQRLAGALQDGGVAPGVDRPRDWRSSLAVTMRARRDAVDDAQAALEAVGRACRWPAAARHRGFSGLGVFVERVDGRQHDRVGDRVLLTFTSSTGQGAWRSSSQSV
jgi:hypothetical protein